MNIRLGPRTRNPHQEYRRAAIADIRRHHRPQRTTLLRRRTGYCTCGERIGGATCWILADSLAYYGVTA